MKTEKIVYWLLFLFLAYVIFELVRKLLGGSLAFEELIVALLVANLGYSFYINTRLSHHIGWHRGRENSRVRR